MKTFPRFLLSISLLGAGLVAPATRAQAGEVSVGVSVGVRLPHGAVRVHVGRDRYFYHRGVYYRPTPHGYVVVRAPRGARVRVLPHAVVRVVIGGAVYYRDADVYYRRLPGGYFEVCEPPVVVVHEAPSVRTESSPSPSVAPVAPVDASGYLQCTLGSARYFFKSGMFFQNTEKGYVLVEPPIGALAEHLPQDSVSVEIDGTEYFQSGDMLFKLTADGFMVAGKR